MRIYLGFCHGSLLSVLKKRGSESAPDLEWLKDFIRKIARGKGLVPKCSQRKRSLGAVGRKSGLWRTGPLAKPPAFTATQDSRSSLLLFYFSEPEDLDSPYSGGTFFSRSVKQYIHFTGLRRHLHTNSNRCCCWIDTRFPAFRALLIY